MRISRELVDEMVAHALADAPNECCGVIAVEENRAVRVYRTTNLKASPLAYEIGPEIVRATSEIEDAGQRLGAIYHSHTRSDPYPSQTDVNLAFVPPDDDKVWPGAIYVIIGVAGDQPEVRAFDIPARDRIEEVELDIEP